MRLPLAWVALSAVVASLGLAPPAWGQATPSANPGPGLSYQGQLTNGMTLLVVEDPKAPVVSLAIAVRVGSRDERPGITGSSHLLEHMLFQGSRSMPPGVFDRRIVEAGGSDNAFTTENLTVYHETLAANRLAMAFELEGDRFRGATLPADKLTSEKQVVREELRWRSENAPAGAGWEALMASLFMADPYHWPVGGWPSDVDSVTREELMGHYLAYYWPNNAAVVVVGDVKVAEVRALAERHLGGLPKGELPRRARPEEPPMEGERRIDLRKPVASPLLLMGWRLPPAGSPELAPYEVLAELLAGGRASRLEARLVRARGLAASVEVGVEAGLDHSVGYVVARPLPGVQLATLEKAIDAELQAMASSQKPTEAERARALAGLELEKLQGRESSEGLAAELSVRWGLNTLDEAKGGLARLRAVDTQALAQAAGQLQPQKRVLVRVIPSEPQR